MTLAANGRMIDSRMAMGAFAAHCQVNRSLPSSQRLCEIVQSVMLVSSRLSSSDPRRAIWCGSLCINVAYELQRAEIPRNNNEVSWLQRWTWYQADLGVELGGRARLLPSKHQKDNLVQERRLVKRCLVSVQTSVGEIITMAARKRQGREEPGRRMPAEESRVRGIRAL